MKEGRSNTWLIVGSLIMAILPMTSSAQTTSAPEKQKYVDTSKVRDGSPHSLYTGIGYSNRMNYLGSNLSQDLPLFSASLTYGFKEEIFAAMSVNHLSAFDPLVSFSTLSMSYNHDFNSWFDISASLSGYHVNSGLTDSLFNNFVYGNLAAGFDWKILYTAISVGGIFSESVGAYVQMRNSRYFESSEFFRVKAFMSFDPFINLMLGNLTRTITPEGTIIGTSQPFKSPRSSGQGSGTSVSTFFGVMELDFGLPVGLNIGNLTIEAEPGYVLPTFAVSDTSTPKGFTLFVNIYYRIL